MQYLQTSDLSKYSFYANLPEDAHRYLRLEGYVFPDTYEFYIESDVSVVVDKFLSNFDLHLNNENLTDRMKTINMTLDEVIILASIIEKEANATEMRRVSSVFHNRLNNPANYPALQSDVTINYVEEHIKNETRSYTQQPTQELYDDYNTYVKTGLPVGPIANPGEEAILAALHPSETNYYYFVTDINGKYYFSNSLAEHDTNVTLARSQDESGKGWIGGVKTHEEGADAIK